MHVPNRTRIYFDKKVYKTVYTHTGVSPILKVGFFLCSNFVSNQWRTNNNKNLLLLLLLLLLSFRRQFNSINKLEQFQTDFRRS